jgi:hypothetical protein
MGTTTGDAGLTTFHPGAERRSERIVSLDIARGIIMVLMAIDHVRVYAGVPAGGPTFGVFFTRWVTHFAAPGFAFLAGTGAFLYGRKIGVLIVVGQSAFGPIGNALPSAIGNFLYLGDQVRLGPNGPHDRVVRRRRRNIGSHATGARERTAGAFQNAQSAQVPGVSPLPTDDARTPPRLCTNRRDHARARRITLHDLRPSPSLLLSAPHPADPRLGARRLAPARGPPRPMALRQPPAEPPPVPPGYRWSLPLLYLVFAIVIALLYIPCKWYGDAKRRDKSGLLRYI